METGICKWYDSRKGYGFITRDDNGEDVFVHHSSIVMEGYKSLTEGDQVKFDVDTSGIKGPSAINVTVIREE